MKKNKLQRTVLPVTFPNAVCEGGGNSMVDRGRVKCPPTCTPYGRLRRAAFGFRRPTKRRRCPGRVVLPVKKTRFERRPVFARLTSSAMSCAGHVPGTRKDNKKKKKNQTKKYQRKDDVGGAKRSSGRRPFRLCGEREKK